MSTQTEFLTQIHWGEVGGSGWPKFDLVWETKNKSFQSCPRAVQLDPSNSPGFLASTLGALQWLFFYLYYFPAGMKQVKSTR